MHVCVYALGWTGGLSRLFPAFHLMGSGIGSMNIILWTGKILPVLLAISIKASIADDHHTNMLSTTYHCCQIKVSYLYFVMFIFENACCRSHLVHIFRTKKTQSVSAVTLRMVSGRHVC